jgi:AraC-like DNA-binding protein
MMRISEENKLLEVLQDGNSTYIRNPWNRSRITLSKIKKASGTLDGNDGYAVFIVLNGKKSYCIDGDIFNLSAGQFLVTDYDKPCFLEVACEEECVGLNIRVNKSIFDQVIACISQPEEKLIDTEPIADNNNIFHLHQGIYFLNENYLGKFLNGLVKTSLNTDSHLEADQTETFFEIAESLIHQRLEIDKNLFKNKAAKKASTRRELYARVLKARSIIYDNINNEINVSDIAREVALSEFHFYRVFKKTFGLSPYQFYINKKLDHSIHLIKNSEGSLSDIAYGQGFTNLSTFSRAFKTHFGLAPIEYKKQFCIRSVRHK